MYVHAVSCFFKTQENITNIFSLFKRLQINGLLKVNRKCKGHAIPTPFPWNVCCYVEVKTLYKFVGT